MRRLFLVLLVASIAGGCRKPSKSNTSDTDVERGWVGSPLPGAEPHPKELVDALRAELAARGDAPRTRHLDAAGNPLYTNRLALETNPYLAQHAHNPVNWYPWGDEAFAAARALDRPVFLSIGYSTCHWCHVMEEESFEDPEIAAYLNRHYIAIKVDREERPDIDSIYMTAVQMMTGRGGWPLSVWLTHDRTPFFGGTYVPPRTGVRGARMGFLELLERIHRGWTEDRPDLLDAAGGLRGKLEQQLNSAAPDATFDGVGALHRAVEGYRRNYDRTWGGLRGDTKFPSALPVRLLLRYARRTGDADAREMALHTLRKMASGGMYDHVGGGFHRYSTDAEWLVPHFEKMLYDNALLVPAYLEGYQVSGDEELAAVARQVLRYVLREMTSPEGGFYSATDADSPAPGGGRREGLFFVWTAAELDALLADRAPLVRDYFAVTEAGNLEGKNILSTPRPLGEVAAERGLSLVEGRRAIEESREILYAERLRRAPPLRDEKIVTAWNAMMISALVRADLVLGANVDGGPSYVDRAVRAGRLLLDKLVVDGRLRRSYHRGQARLPAYLTDYAFTIAAMLDLYEATGEPAWLEHARRLDRTLAEQYEDREHGGFFLVAADSEALLAREKPMDDGAVPSGNSVAALCLVRLYELTGDVSYRSRAERAFEAHAGVLSRDPTRLSELLIAVDAFTDAVKQIVIVTPEREGSAAPFLAELRRRFVPNRVLVVVPEREVDHAAAIARDKRALRGATTAYVCEAQRCELPAREPALFGRQLDKVIALPK